jgi:hypothetical protein
MHFASPPDEKCGQVALLRKEMAENPDLLASLGLQPSFAGFAAAADG